MSNDYMTKKLEYENEGSYTKYFKHETIDEARHQL